MRMSENRAGVPVFSVIAQSEKGKNYGFSKKKVAFIIYFLKSCVLVQAARETLLYGGSDLSLNLQLTLILYCTS